MIEHRLREGDCNMNRVTTNRGRLPIMVVAPHGFPQDDFNTDIMAEVIATELTAYSVINTGWRRAKRAALGENIANLNDVSHCKLSPVKREFLDPIIAFKNEIVKKFNHCSVFYIHGMSNEIRRKTYDNVDIVIGYGEGEPPSYTCDLDYKNAMIVQLQNENFVTYQGKSGGKFSAWKKNNLTQLFRRHDSDYRVQSTQLEIVNLRRYDVEEAVKSALAITRALDRLLHDKTTFNRSLDIKEY